jgi:transposase
VNGARPHLRTVAGRKHGWPSVHFSVSPANEQDRSQVEQLARAVKEATGESVELAYVDQGYTGEAAEQAAAEHGIQFEVVKHQEAKRGFVLLPRRWVVERSFAWMSRFRRLARNYARIPETSAALHYVAFAMLMLSRYMSTTPSS